MPRAKKNDQGTIPSKKLRISMADKADKHRLYEKAVQCAEAEIDFVSDTFKALRKRQARLLREDFCGTANSSCEWVRRRPAHRAVSIDLDPEVLAWGREHNITALTRGAQRRIKLVCDDVMKAKTDPVDVVLAMNFSYWLFKSRETLCRYFRRVYDGLVQDGVFFLDAFGGFEAFREMEESTEYDDFTYIWDQAHYNPITGDYICKIHFTFADGSRLKNAFIYDWRLWTLPELMELLAEAGFKPTIYWEGTDENNEGNGIFTPTRQGEADAGWIAYIVAEKI